MVPSRHQRGPGTAMTPSQTSSSLAFMALMLFLKLAVGQLSTLGLPDNLDGFNNGLIGNSPSTAPAPTQPTTFCNMTPTWFPKDWENRAFPAPLTLDSQQAAGWDGTGDPWRVALGDDRIPRFYFGVNWFALQQAAVPTECQAGLQTMLCSSTSKAEARSASFGKRLHATSGAIVTKAAKYQASWRLNSGASIPLGTFSPGQTNAPFPIVLQDFQTLDDGDYCIYATATAIQRSGTVSINGQLHDFPCSNVTETRKYCFVRARNRPTSVVKFDSCNANFTASFTNISPRAAYAAIPTPNNPVELFSVLVHIYGNASLDDVFDQRPPDEQGEGITRYVDATIPLTDPVEDSVVFTTDRLLDGTYNLFIEMLIQSDFPSLVNLSGITQLENGSATYQGWIVNTTSKGKPPMHRVTVFHEKSDVFGLVCPSDPVRTLPASRSFAWEFTGQGRFDCFVDNRLLNNDGAKQCKSPLVLDLTDRKNHTVVIRFTDVCKNQIFKKFIFGAWGCEIDRTGEPPAPPPPPPPAPEAPPSNDLGMLGSGNITGLFESGSAHRTCSAAPQLALLAAVLLSTLMWLV